MTNHDRVRMEFALKVKERLDSVSSDTDITSLLEDLREAVLKLQSTDDPSLVPLHDELLFWLRMYEDVR